ncbi:NADP-dependent oxidoreductase domain-containing protein [Fomitopsis serialis]|uniref:NADP-dependent oxidoreductase domain-containing protein n=1 Tax=Fomitopsis serialis TaxID=139415 RepID=UPI0020085E33|nr:NADP-dependent oxidoreductase domain-containing protein [Neoantrodia serialis]KAH9935036.1 NADP-dependent oxidoreductase domain-containing protein [Neoantrodia serialis]
MSITLNDGTKIPSLGFGTGTALYAKDAEDTVRQAIQTGVVHLDVLGAGIVSSGKPRSSLYITTKLNSLKKLQTEYVDLFLVHFPNNHETPLPEIWAQFEEIQKEGLAKSIGVSNFRVKDFEEILPTAKVIPAVNQIEYHPYVYKADQPVIEFMKKYNITPSHTGGPVDPVLKSAAARLSKEAGTTVTEGQVLQLWLKAKGVVTITTSSKASRVKEYLAAEALPGLTPEEIKAIDTEGSKVHHRVFVSVLVRSHDVHSTLMRNIGHVLRLVKDLRKGSIAEDLYASYHVSSTSRMIDDIASLSVRPFCVRVS